MQILSRGGAAGRQGATPRDLPTYYCPDIIFVFSGIQCGAETPYTAVEVF